MATDFPKYPASTFEQAVDLTIFSGNQLHDVINGDATTEVETENGTIPTVRKSLVDNMYFRDPIDWQSGAVETVFNQLRLFKDGDNTAWYFAPSATVATPVPMGDSPVGDFNWKIFGDSISAATQKYAEQAKSAADAAKVSETNAEDAAARAESAAGDAIVSAGIYESLQAAQTAANEGKIPVDSVVGVLSSEDNRFIELYKNVSGTMTPVLDNEGNIKSTPSGSYVDKISSDLTVLDNRTAGIYTVEENDGRTVFADVKGLMSLEIEKDGTKNLYGETNTYKLSVEESLSMSDSDILPSEDTGYYFGVAGKNLKVGFGFRDDGETLDLRGVPISTQRGALPPDVFCIGDSITAFGQASSGANATGKIYKPLINAQCWAGWAQLFTNSQFRYVGMSATGGYTASQILTTHVPKAIAAKPTFCMVMCGRNDVVQNINVDTITIPTMTQIFRQLRYAGIIPIICSMSAQSGNSPTQNKARYKINAFCRAYAEKYGLPFVDLHAYTTDPLTGEWKSGYNQDVSHPWPVGAKAMGQAVADTMSKWQAPTHCRKAESVTDPESSDNALDNPLFINSTDGIPDGWIVDNNTGSFSISQDPAVKGNVFTLVGGGGNIAAAHKTISVTPGERFSFGVYTKIAASNSSWNACYVVAGDSIEDTDSTVYLAGLRNWKYDSDWGYFYFEFDVPEDQTEVTIVLKAQAGTTLNVAQMGIFEVADTTGV